MRYNTLDRHNRSICFSSVCSICGRHVDASDKFCRNCGHELVHLPARISMDKVCEIMSEAARKGITEAPAEERGISKDEEWEETAPKQLPTDSWVCKGKPQCLHGDHDPSTCGHCLPSGACDACVLTSFPPQYNMCPFRGEGFITCEDAR